MELVVLPSPYRSLLQPLLTYVDSIEAAHPEDKINVIIGEFASDKWWHPLLHGNSGLLLKVALLARPDIIVTNVRYKIGSNTDSRTAEKQRNDQTKDAAESSPLKQEIQRQ